MDKKNVLVYGTFDLFHIGHENILKGAKRIAEELGGELIVGVTTNDFDRDRGKIDVFNTYEERELNVKKTGMCDVIIPETYVGQKIYDIKKYNVHSIVFGSDWKGKMDYLNEYCNVVYLPRTEGISSTMLRVEKKNKNTAIVIGGTSDIGMGIIDMLLKRGYYVVSTYNSTPPIISDKNIKWIKTDLTKKDDIKKLCVSLKDVIKSVDVFIFNAGITCRKGIEKIEDEDIYNVFNVNVFSCLMLIRELFNNFVNKSKIIVTGSQMGVSPHSTSILYGMSKECLHSMVKNLVKELECKEITINAIVPGFIETKWQVSKKQEIKDNICRKTAIHRFGSVDEVVKGFEFCLDNNFVNGSLIEINGGYCYE